MSFRDLLDQQEVVEAYGQLGNKGCMQLAEALHKRASISTDFARSLYKVSKNYGDLAGQYFEDKADASEGDTELSMIVAMAEEGKTLADNYFSLASFFEQDLVASLRNIATTHDRSRREILAAIKASKKEYKKAVAAYEKIQKARDSAMKAVENAKVSLDKAAMEKGLNRAYMDKLKDEYTTRARKCLVAREEHVQARRALIERQRSLWTVDLADLFEKLQTAESQRLAAIKETMTRAASTMLEHAGKMLVAATEFGDTVQSWDIAAVVRSFAEKNRKVDGFEVPELLLPELESEAPPLVYTPLATLSADQINDLSKLTYDKASLELRLEDVRRQTAAIEKQREGVRVLHAAYTRQPALADDRTRAEVSRQMIELSLSLEQLTMAEGECERAIERLAGGQYNTANYNASAASWENESILTRSSSAGAMAESPKPGAAGSLLTAIPNGISPAALTKQSRSNSIISATAAPNPTSTPIKNSSAFIVPQITPPEIGNDPNTLFKVRALYEFKAAPDTDELSMRQGEILAVLNVDDLHWWQARRLNIGDKREDVMGYVPYNYVERI